MGKKVSIIVPIYNVEQYLSQCLESLIQQTHHTLEILLINDGSTDQSGQIAEHYQELDARVRVFHKENGGLSDARNFGLKVATGEYILFVDSDDWVEQSMVAQLLTLAATFDADIVQAAFLYAFEGYCLYDQRYIERENPVAVLDRQTVMTELVKNEKIKNFAWGKLYKRRLISDLPFKKGVRFEDVFWAHHVVHRTHRYVMVNQPLYYYRQREDSIVGAYSPKNLDIITGLKERHAFIETHYQGLIQASNQLIVKTCLIHYHLLFRYCRSSEGRRHRKLLQNAIQAHVQDYKKAVHKHRQLSLYLRAFLLHPYCYICILLVKSIIGRIGRLCRKPQGLVRIEQPRKEMNG
ncbi:glycosyl transferase [Pullulanibacillus camelliae]|uniref:Glycosyl transferase n=1 Tax=Pullulanibacillus camelliae TaxID=1707096 RepID=A0A8J2YFN0_9BACL|nr:glycosyltransferase [Pullulanibacillus camelliae]GGE30517.1 glycosyl transferase [Pullulanibacillus camelliae]